MILQIVNVKKLILIVLLLWCAKLSAQLLPKVAPVTPEQKPRLVVLTDIAPGNIEPDDMESMVRLMTYNDQVEIEALITTIGWNCFEGRGREASDRLLAQCRLSA